MHKNMQKKDIRKKGHAYPYNVFSFRLQNLVLSLRTNILPVFDSSISLTFE